MNKMLWKGLAVSCLALFAASRFLGSDRARAGGDSDPPALLIIAQFDQPDPADPFWSEWNRLAEHKWNKRGLRTEIVRMEDILTGPDHGQDPDQGLRPAVDNAEKVKNYLRYRKLEHWDTLQCALIGVNFDDGNGVDVQELFPVRRAPFEVPGEGLTPVSIPYYSDLFNADGTPATWDDDNDWNLPGGGFAEYSVDRFSLDFDREQGDISVGYLPVIKTKADEARVLKAMVDKIIGFEDPEYDPDGPGGIPAGKAFPRIEAGSPFLKWNLFGASINERGSDRHGEIDSRDLETYVVRPSRMWLPVDVRFLVTGHYLGTPPDYRDRLLPVSIPPGTLQKGESVSYFCDRLNAGCGFVFTTGHGDFGNSSAYNDEGLPGDHSFPWIVGNWTHPAYGGATVDNAFGPYPLLCSLGCNIFWTDSTKFPHIAPQYWGMQCLAEDLMMCRSADNPAFEPRGIIGGYGSCRGMYEDSGFAYALFLGYTHGRARTLGEMYSESQRIYLARQDLWGADDDWGFAGSKGKSGGLYVFNQCMMTYIGDPSLKFPDIPGPGLTYRDRAADFGLGGLAGDLRAVAVCDFDADTVDDLVLAASPVRVLRGSFQGGYAEAAALANPASAARALAVGDVDNDGNMDLFVANSGQSLLYVKDGGWVFTDRTAQYGLSGITGDTTHAVLRDLNLDGWQDLALLRDGTLFVYENADNNPGRIFVDRTAAWGFAGVSRGTCLSVTDCNGDGLPDLFVGTDPANLSRGFFGVTRGTWSDSLFSNIPPQHFPSDSRVEGFTWEDFDGDGDLDLLLGMLDGNGAVEGHIKMDDLFERNQEGILVSRTDGFGSGGFGNRGETRAFSGGDLDLDGNSDVVFFNRYGTKLARGGGDWSSRSRVLDDGLPLSEEMTGGALVDWGAGQMNLLGLRVAGHAGAHPRGAVRYWVSDRQQGDAPEGQQGFAPPYRYLRVRLRGAGTPGLSPRDAVGARVTITSDMLAGGDSRTQTKTVSRDGHSEGLVFGLWLHDRVTELHIEWPSGATQSVATMPQQNLRDPVVLYEDPQSLLPQPGAVSDLAAQRAPDYSRITVAWDANPPDEQADHYEVWRSVNGAAFAHRSDAPAQGGQVQHLDAMGPADYGNSYAYRVRAVNAWGKGLWASPTAPILVDPRPGVPTQFGVVKLGQDVHLNWEPPVGGNPVEYYQVYRFTSPDQIPVPVGVPIPPQPYGQGVVLQGAGDGFLYLVGAGNAYASRLTPYMAPLPFWDSLSIQPAGGDLNVPAGTRVQLRAYVVLQSYNVPVTHVDATAWISDRPLENPISPPNSGGLVCNVAGPTAVTATFGQMQAQETYNVILQNPVAPPKGAGPAKPTKQ